MPQWPLQRLVHEQTGLNDRALVLYEIARNARRVATASVRAETLGIHPGMTVSEATALAESAAVPLVAEPADPAADRRALEQLAQASQQFSPVVGLEEATAPECLLLDITGLAHLFGGESRLVAEFTRSLTRRGLAVRVAVAGTVGAAWALAHYAESSEERLEQLPIEALRLPPETVDVLHQLGIFGIGQLAVLPRADLGTRLGAELLRRWDQAFGNVAEPIQGQPFPVELEADQVLDPPSGRRDTLAFVMTQLVGRVAEMLFRSGRGATQLCCRLHCGANPVDLRVGLFEPTASAEHLAQLVEMRFERLTLPAPVSAVSVRAVTTALLQRRQSELFGDARETQHPRLLAALVDRLSSRLGLRAVLRPRRVADAQPELAYDYDPLVASSLRLRKVSGWLGPRVARSQESSSPGDSLRSRPSHPMPDALPPRPLRLLVRPVAVAAVSLLPDGPPLQFPWQGQPQRIAERWGPERIQTGWWRGQAIGRDYYRVATTTGRRFWIFRRLRDGRWFLQGVFE